MRQKPAAKYELISNEIEQSNDEKKAHFVNLDQLLNVQDARV